MQPKLMPLGEYFVLARTRRQFDRWLLANKYPRECVHYIESEQSLRGCRIAAHQMVAVQGWIENPAYDHGFLEMLGDCTPWDYIRAIGEDFLALKAGSRSPARI